MVNLNEARTDGNTADVDRLDLDDLDKAIINSLQGNFPVCDRPFAAVAEQLSTTEEELMRRIEQLLENGTLTRFGPMYNADRMGGAFTLCAMRVPENDFDTVAEHVNSYRQVAHNYAREHDLNMWFVVATDEPAEVDNVIHAIQSHTRLTVYNMPKLEEFFVELRFVV